MPAPSAPAAEAAMDSAPAPKRALAKVAKEEEKSRDKGGKDDDDGDGIGGSSKAIAVRSNFNPLAAFAPAVKTDSAGRATVR